MSMDRESKQRGPRGYKYTCPLSLSLNPRPAKVQMSSLLSAFHLSSITQQRGNRLNPSAKVHSFQNYPNAV